MLGLTFLLVAFGALTTVARTRQFEARRDEMKQLPGSATDRVLREADAHALALGAFREVLAANGGRFAVEFGPDIPASDRRTILLVSGATFLPATGVAQRVDADFLVTFGRVPTSSRVGFTGVATVDDGWLGRRTG